MTKIDVEVFVASQLLSRGQSTFTTHELRREIERRFGGTRPGVDTHLSFHCVANAPRNARTGHSYLWRLDQGVLRVFKPRTDRPHPTRMEAWQVPDEDDVAVEYRYLLRQAIDSGDGC